MADQPSYDGPEELVEVHELLVEQASALVKDIDGISRIIQTLAIPFEELEEWADTDRHFHFSFDSMIRVFMYKHASGLDQQTLAKRLKRWPYLQNDFELQRAPGQPTISNTKRNRFDRELRQFLEAVGIGLREVAEEADVRVSGVADVPTIDEPEDNDGPEPITHFVDREANNLLETASDFIFPAFDTGRASNTKHSDDTVWTSQTRMSLLNKRVGSQTVYRTFNRERDDALHHDTHIRAVKKAASPDGYQSTMDDFSRFGTGPKPYWKQVAETIDEPFDEVVGNLLDELVDTDMITQPVVAAIDFTTDPYYVYPWKKEGEEAADDELIERNSGDLRAAKDNYPGMVSGTLDHHEYGYRYATLTIINRDTPLVLAVEPVRENSNWETEGETTPKAAAVKRLMEKATDHVDIHMVMADRGFDVKRVRHILDDYGVTYLHPKKEYSKDLENIEKIEEHPTAKAAVQSDVPMEAPDGSQSHTGHYLYVPAQSDEMSLAEDLDEDISYAVFVTNRDDVLPGDELQLVQRYRNRWDIENTYRCIKRFIPSVASKDYRVRCFSFMWATLLYNVWRLVDAQLQILVGEKYDDYDPDPVDGRPDTLITAVGCVFTLMNHLDPPD